MPKTFPRYLIFTVGYSLNVPIWIGKMYQDVLICIISTFKFGEMYMSVVEFRSNRFSLLISKFSRLMFWYEFFTSMSSHEFVFSFDFITYLMLEIYEKCIHYSTSKNISISRHQIFKSFFKGIALFSDNWCYYYYLQFCLSVRSYSVEWIISNLMAWSFLDWSQSACILKAFKAKSNSTALPCMIHILHEQTCFPV